MALEEKRAEGANSASAYSKESSAKIAFAVHIPQSNTHHRISYSSHTLTRLPYLSFIIANMSFGKLYTREAGLLMLPMFMAPTLLTLLLQSNVRSKAIRAVAKANKLDLEIVETDGSKGPLSTEYLKLNKLGKIPSFVGADGYELTECIAIAIYGTLHYRHW